nr:Chain A, Signal recognition particle protein,Signal recognition particle 54 kDa protein [Thermus aquaticus]
MFQQLSARLQEAIGRLRGRGRITEEDLKATLREIRRALMDADVNLEVARDFVERVREEALGKQVLESLTPAEVILATVYEALKEALGGEARLPVLKDRNLWFLVGLQGSGKTTTAAKLALYYKGKGRRPLLVAADTQRPAAREQLRLLGEKVGVPVLEVMDGESPESIRRRVEEKARLEARDLILVDTAGRLQIDEPLMGELARLKEVLGPDEVLLVLDAMTGQEALSVARAFDEKVGVTGLVLTKLDGDARGGAALSARHVTGKPIYFAGVSEKPEGLEPFYPERLAGRILGMGDIESILEKVKGLEEYDKIQKKMEDVMEGKGKLTLRDVYAQIIALRKMGPLSKVLQHIPGLGIMLPTPSEDQLKIGEEKIRRWLAALNSMTYKELENPNIIDKSRMRRIAEGSGLEVEEVRELLEWYNNMNRLLKMVK